MVSNRKAGGYVLPDGKDEGADQQPLRISSGSRARNEDRVRDFATTQQQNEKMMTLGKLFTGLADELNNSASAIVHGSISLKQRFHLVPETFKIVIAIGMCVEDIDKVNNKA